LEGLLLGLLPELHHRVDRLLELRLGLHRLEDRLLGLLLEDRHRVDRPLELRRLGDRLLEDRHSGLRHLVGRHLEGLLQLQGLERVPKVLQMAFQRLEDLHHPQLQLRYQTLLLVCEGSPIVLYQSRLRFQQLI
jgi:hypothetical protein